ASVPLLPRPRTLVCFLIGMESCNKRRQLDGSALVPEQLGNGESTGCWLPRRFPRAVLVLIDALAFEFARFEPARRAPRPFENRLPVLHELARRQPRHGRLFRFRADPPTTTMQRIKGLTTGSLPTFVDAGSNFASYAVQEDNLIRQLAQNGKRVVFMGDDTWDGLFPQAFFRSYFFPSFNVKDLHTVDEGILQHLYQTVDGGEWDLLIAHFLGVDHCGHKHGPDHPEMAKKLSQMDGVLRALVDHLANDTVLLVAGDHGMTGTGDHGGDSEEEVDAALFVYRLPCRPCYRTLLHPNIGEVMADLFAVEGDAAASALAQLAAYSINAGQVHRFLHSYSLAAQDIPAEKLQRLRDLFSSTAEAHEQLLAQPGSALLPQLEHLQGLFRRYLREARAACEETWARFHLARMLAGCALLASSCVLCYVASRVALDRAFSYRRLLLYPVLWGLAGAALLGLAHLGGWAGVDPLLLSSWGAAASQLGFFWHCWSGRLQAGPGQALPVGILLARCGASLSDSFVVAEARVAPFLLGSLALALVLRLHWRGRLAGSRGPPQLLGCLGAVLLCARLSGLFWQCREETPHCRSSPLLAPLSSLQSPRAKNLCYVLCLAGLAGQAWGVRRWLQHHGNLNSPSAPALVARWGLPLLALGLGGYWAVTSGAEEELARLHAWVQLALAALPRGIFGLVALGLLLLLWSPVTVFVQDGREPPGAGVPVAYPSSEAELRQVIPQLYRRMQESLRSRLAEAQAGGGATVAAYGLGSVYSAALLVGLALLGFLLMALHSERLSLAFLLLFLEAFALLWMVTGGLPVAAPFEVAWSALVLWALAATQFFYATGHQPVFPAIHWNAAFVGFQQGHAGVLVPALLVGANTFASHVLFAAGCPLLLLWPFVCEALTSRGRRPRAELPQPGEQMMEMRLREDPARFVAALLQLGLKYLCVLGVQLLACVLAAFILRRHLMVWKVFAPKFLFEALGFVASSVFLLLGLGLVMRVDCAVSAWFKRVILAQSR
uniref:Phosphatidylinositol glycan anchor biosynthesis class O n=1 Tax=Varanus komodoensis TaxID=61221 RepID=A0A8D2Q779_VARKO